MIIIMSKRFNYRKLQKIDLVRTALPHRVIRIEKTVRRFFPTCTMELKKTRASEATIFTPQNMKSA